MPPANTSRFPNQRVFKDMPVTSWTGAWSTATIDGALNAHDQGQFMMSAQLAEAVQRDARVSSALNTRAKGVVGLPVTITASTAGDPEQAEQAAEAIRKRWRESNWAADLVQVLRWQILMGFGLAELVWSGDAERWDFDLDLWHPQFLWFNWADRNYTLNTAEGPVAVTPGDGKWLLYTPEGPYRAWINGGVRSIAQPWLGRQHEKRDWMRFCELYGLGILKAKVPSGTIEGDKDTFFDSLTVGRGSELVVLCPQGSTPQESYDVELLEATATGWQTFEAAIGQDNKEIAIALLGQNLTSDVDGGSFAAATVHAAVKQDYIEADARGLALAFLTQALRLWAQFNYGDAGLAPTLAWDTKPPEDRAAEADTLGKVSGAAVDLGQVAPEVDRRALLKRFGIPLLPEEKGDADTAGSQIFAYHIQNGIVTINEVRANLGLPPIEGGNVLAKPAGADDGGDAEPTEEEGGEPSEDTGESKQATARSKLTRQLRSLADAFDKLRRLWPGR